MGHDFTLGLIGGTGMEGRGIALRLAAAGIRVALGSRDPVKARDTTAELNRVLTTDLIQGFDNGTVLSHSRLILLTIPFAGAAEWLQENRTQLEDRIVIDATVPVHFEKGPRWIELDQGSGSEYLQGQLPPVTPLVAAFKTIPAHLLNEINRPLACDEFLCSDSPEAAQEVFKVVGQIPELRWIDCGSLRFARTLESMTVLAIGLNRRHKSKESRFRVIGL